MWEIYQKADATLAATKNSGSTQDLYPRSSPSRGLHSIAGPSREALYFRKQPEHIHACGEYRA